MRKGNISCSAIGFYCSTYVTTRCDMVTVECIESKKSEGQTSKQTYKQTNQRRRKDYSRRAAIIKVFSRSIKCISRAKLALLSVCVLATCS